MNKDSEQLSFIEDKQTDNEPVVCLGMEFESDEKRREYFRDELRKKLPELKEIEGFPIGEDEAIIELSDPPYYTICPNPWINDFIEDAETSKLDIDKVFRVKEPFTADVSEGKNDRIYTSHTYHTKVPPKAIMRYLLHYTQPGDIVLDSFCGSGMMGVASYMCGEKEKVEELDMKVSSVGDIYNLNGSSIPISKLGARKAILNDLSPAASFIADYFNSPQISKVANRKIKETIKQAQQKMSFIYRTLATENEELKKEIMLELDNANDIQKIQEVIYNHRSIFGETNYTIWSDVFICPNCSNEIIYAENAIDYKNATVMKKIICPNCKVEINKRKADIYWETKYDSAMDQLIKQGKQVPFKINYTFQGKRFEKSPDELDLLLMSKLSDLMSSFDIPIGKLPEGYNTKQPIGSHGLTHVHHFYTDKNLAVISYLWKNLERSLRWILTSFLSRNATKMNRFVINKHNPKGRINGPLTGTLYIPSLAVEQSIFQLMNDRLIELNWATKGNITQVGSATSLDIIDNSVDYIFIDPPFGANIMYSEVNFIWETWLGVKTDNEKEAIQNPVQNKNLNEYKNLMVKSFKECHRVLKYGRWITVEFSNTQASVWNAIQLSLQEAGFVIANVTSLDKKHGGIRAMTNTTSVKQDLVISAYKPVVIEFPKSGSKTKDSSLFQFVDEHLKYLPVFGEESKIKYILERDPRIIYDRLVAYFVSNGIEIPMSSPDFQKEIYKRYPDRDGMVFLDTQVIEYDRKRITLKDFAQMNLFVSDESSAIEWIRQQLMTKPQSRQDLHPKFMMEIQHIAKHELLPELDDLINENFLYYDGEGVVPNQILTYLRRNFKDLRGLEPNNPLVIKKATNRWYVPNPNKQADLEKLRERSLLREFDGYLVELDQHKRKLNQFRTEAIRAGFKKAFSDKDYEKIITVGERLPSRVIPEDDKLLMYFDNASIRLGL